MYIYIYKERGGEEEVETVTPLTAAGWHHGYMFMCVYIYEGGQRD